MKKLKIGGLVLLGLGGLAVLGGYVIPGEVQLETEAHLAAPPEAIFEVLNGYEGQILWWTEAMKAYAGEGMPPMNVVHRGGPAAGKGMQLNFLYDEELAEEWEVLESEAPTSITYEVDFQMFVTERTLVLEADGTGTKIIWTEVANLDPGMMRYMTLMPQDEVIGNFDRALVALGKVTAPGN
jgi:hypothetical protein